LTTDERERDRRDASLPPHTAHPARGVEIRIRAPPVPRVDWRRARVTRDPGDWCHWRVPAGRALRASRPPERERHQRRGREDTGP